MAVTCARCGATEEITTRSDEVFGQRLAALGWLIWLPHRQALCPRCATEPRSPSTVSP